MKPTQLQFFGCFASLDRKSVWFRHHGREFYSTESIWYMHMLLTTIVLEHEHASSQEKK